MKTAALAAVVTAVILFLAFCKVDVTIIRKSAVEQRAEVRAKSIDIGKCRRREGEPP